MPRIDGVHTSGDLSPSFDACDVDGERRRSETIRDEVGGPDVTATQDLGDLGPAFVISRQADSRDRGKRRLEALALP